MFTKKTKIFLLLIAMLSAITFTACGGGSGGGSTSNSGGGGGNSSGGGNGGGDPAVSSTWLTAAAGREHTVAIKTDGTLWAWGSNNSGQLGNSSVFSYTDTPVQVGSDADWLQVTAANDHTLAIKTDGTLWAWGNNTVGQLGLGDTTRRNIPVQVGAATTWVRVVTSQGHTIGVQINSFSLLGFIFTSHDMFTWGSNYLGELGLGGTSNRETTPQFVSGGFFGNGWDENAIAAGHGYSIARKLDGRLFSWGINTEGELGTGDYIARSSPAEIGQITTPNNVVMPNNWKPLVAAGYAHNIAVLADGSLWTWGWNEFGVGVGAGNVGDIFSSPTQIDIGPDWSSVSAGAGHSVALYSNGDLYAWGDNAYGQLGVGDWNNRPTIFYVPAGNDWKFVTAGSWHTVAIKNDGSLWTWGWNNWGQLGDGTRVDKNTPTKMP